MTNTRLVSMDLVTKRQEAKAFRWGPSWEAMMDTAERLGALGQMFTIEFTSEEDERRGIDILPELVLLDGRYRKHTVTHGLWVVVHPGTRNFRVLTEDQIYAEYGVLNSDGVPEFGEEDLGYL